MKISKEILQTLAERYDTGGFRVVQTDIVGTSRWSIINEQIIQHEETGKYYLTRFFKGAAGWQVESPYEYEDDEVEVEQVTPTEVTVVKYVRIKQ